MIMFERGICGQLLLGSHHGKCCFGHVENQPLEEDRPVCVPGTIHVGTEPFVSIDLPMQLDTSLARYEEIGRIVER